MNQELMPVFQHPRDLSLGISDGQFRPSVEILKQTSFALYEWQFDIHIIGESHWIAIRHESVRVWQEVLACTELDASQYEHIYSFRKDNHFLLEKAFYGIEVFISEPQQPTPMRSWQATSKSQLSLAFPPIYTVIPFTHLQWWQEGDTVYWESCHTYPTEDSLFEVLTKSWFNTQAYR